MNCPSITELCAANAKATFEEHLGSCVRCRALVARRQVDTNELTARPTNIPMPSGGKPEPRAVWSIWAPHAEQYLVVAILEATEEETLVLPLLPRSNWASEADVELDPEVLGYAAVAPLWASDRVLVEQVVEPVDVLSETCFATLCQAYDAFVEGHRIEAPTGAPILGEMDPRLEAQAATAEDLRPWFAPWSMLQGAEELGPVMGQRREDVGLELNRLTDDLGVEPREWRAFEAGSGDPHATIPVRAMATAIRHLGLLASQRLISLARASVLANNAGQTADQPALARRRSRSIRKRRPDAESVQAAADQYASSLAKELGL